LGFHWVTSMKFIGEGHALRTLRKNSLGRNNPLTQGLHLN